MIKLYRPAWFAGFCALIVCLSILACGLECYAGEDDCCEESAELCCCQHLSVSVAAPVHAPSAKSMAPTVISFFVREPGRQCQQERYDTRIERPPDRLYSLLCLFLI